MTPNRQPLVTVIMPVYNREKLVGEAIESILAQTFTDFEFLIVDDGSQDNTAEIVREYQRRDGRIRFMQLAHNVGKGGAVNHGIEAASGPYIAFMDSDDVSLPERLQKQMEFLRANPDIGVVGACAILTDEEMNPLRPWDQPEKHAHIAYNIMMDNSFVAGTLVICVELLKAVGGYELTRRRGVDVELVSRLMYKTRFANLPERLYLFRLHEGSLYHVQDAKGDWIHLQRRLLCRLWGEAPQSALDSFVRVRRGWDKLNWQERRRAKRDLTRYIDAMIAAKWIERADRPYLIGIMNRQLERTSPRLWQMFCHWRRHRFGR